MAVFLKRCDEMLRRFLFNFLLLKAADHPVLLSFPESEYLKCFVLQAV